MRSRLTLPGPVLCRSILNVLTRQCSFCKGTLNNSGELITLEDYSGMRQMWGQCLPKRSTEMNSSAPAENDAGFRLRYSSLCLRDAAGV